MNDIVNRAAILGAFLAEHAKHINSDTFTAARVTGFEIEVQLDEGVTPIAFALNAFPDATVTITRVNDISFGERGFHVVARDSYRGEPIRIVATAKADDAACDYAWINGTPNGRKLTLTAADLLSAISATEGA